AVIADALDDRHRARVAHAEPFAGDAAQINFAAGGAVEHHVSGDDILLGGKRAFARRIDDDLAARQPLAAVVVHIPFDADRHAVHAERQQALPGAAFEIQLDCVFVVESLAAVAAGHFAR